MKILIALVALVLSFSAHAEPFRSMNEECLSNSAQSTAMRKNICSNVDYLKASKGMEVLGQIGVSEYDFDTTLEAYAQAVKLGVVRATNRTSAGSFNLLITTLRPATFSKISICRADRDVVLQVGTKLDEMKKLTVGGYLSASK